MCVDRRLASQGIRTEDNVHSAQEIVACSIKALSAVSKRHYLDQFCESYAKARQKMAEKAQKLADAESERQRVASIQKQIDEINAVKESRKAEMGDLDVGTTRELDKVDCRLIELEEMQHGLALAFAEPDATGGGVNVPTAAGIGNKMAHFGTQVASMSKTLEMVLANQDTLLSRMATADLQVPNTPPKPLLPALSIFLIALLLRSSHGIRNSWLYRSLTL